MISFDKAGEPTDLEGGKMFKKILMAAGLAAAFTLSAHVAEAKVNVIIGIGNSGHCYNHYSPIYCGGYGYFPRRSYGYFPHGSYGYYPRLGFYDPYPPFYDDPYRPNYDYDRVSCKEARWIVRERGFRDVRTTSCGGKYHVFVAKKRGGVFRIKVYSRNGRIQSIRPI